MSSTETANPLTRKPHLSREFIGSISLLALFWVIFCWGFWEKFTDAFGFNMTIFWIGVCFSFALLTPSRLPYTRENLSWSIPTVICSLSYSLYSNYFIAGWNILAIPMIGGTLFLLAHSNHNNQKSWTITYLTRLSLSAILVPVCFFIGAANYIRSVLDLIPISRSVASRIALGLVVLTLLSVLFVLPLLSAAEPIFKLQLESFYTWLFSIYWLESALYRSVVYLILCGTAVIAAVELRTPQSIPDTYNKERDQIVAGIVIGGILLFYLLFLLIQLDRLFVGSLPIDFGETERLVKTGFWQLMFLSALNLVLVEIYRKQTGVIFIPLLQAFSLASLLLLASAAHRMYLYVYYYGLSYEKFYASYAVLYCMVLLGTISWALLLRRNFDAVKFGFTLFIVLYSLVTLLPAEQIIFRTNLALSHDPSSRLALSDMKMLSSDLFQAVHKHWTNGELDHDPAAFLYAKTLEKNGPKTSYTPSPREYCRERTDWSRWIQKRSAELQEKRWYELNLLGVLNLLAQEDAPKHSWRNTGCQKFSSWGASNFNDVVISPGTFQ